MWQPSRIGAPAVTLADVARRAGVGESTVSRVLRGRGSVSAETREQVLSAARDLGYVPNRIAGTLASTDSRLVGLVIPSLTNIVFPELLSSANAVLIEAGLQPVIAVTDYKIEREEAVIESLLSWRPSAILIAGLDHTDHAHLMLRSAGIRIVELLDTDGPGIDLVVGYSNREAGRVTARHLVERGYRRIGYIGHHLDHDRRATKRYEGFRDALAETGLGIAATEILPQGSSIRGGRDGLERLLTLAPDLDAIYFSNDDMAMGGYFHCLAQGIAIPDELAIVGFNGLDIGQYAPQRLTTIRTPRAEVGETGARLIALNAPATTLDMGFTLIEGATT